MNKGLSKSTAETIYCRHSSLRKKTSGRSFGQVWCEPNVNGVSDTRAERCASDRLKVERDWKGDDKKFPMTVLECRSCAAVQNALGTLRLLWIVCYASREADAATGLPQIIWWLHTQQCKRQKASSVQEAGYWHDRLESEDVSRRGSLPVYTVYSITCENSAASQAYKALRQV